MAVIINQNVPNLNYVIIHMYASYHTHTHTHTYAVAELKAEAARIEHETELQCQTQAREAEINFIREQNELEVSKAKELSVIEVIRWSFEG